MSGWKKLAAAAAGGGEVTNVENVFSTYVYAGDSQAQNIDNGIALADSPSGDLGSSTLFENYNESLNKSSDLTGNTDGKTFTFSFWIYPVPTNNNTMYIYHTSGSWKNTISWGLNGTIFVSFFNNESSGGTVFEIQNPDLVCPPNTWSHVIFSADMSDTTKRHLYINDSEATPSWSYSNQTIDWTRSDHAVGDDLTASTGNFNGYMAHFFFDKTYRDLSVTATRRTFIDSARGSTPASTLAALNPILYLPMVSGYSVGENAGTGGNFTGTNSPTIVTNKGTQSVAGVGQGGMVWIKSRTTSTFPGLFDTERGVLNRLRTDGNAVEDSLTRSLTAFNSNGFNLGNNGTVNQTARDYVSWTFRKAPKFFDIVTYTGNGTAGRTISHNLGSTPGCIFIKGTNSVYEWAVYHRGMDSTAPEDYYMWLNQTYPRFDSTGYWNDTAPTSTQFTLGNNGNVNAVGGTYIAYIFAHNDGDGEFGPTGDQDIIKCGSYTGNGQQPAGPEIDLGFEPQWLLIKRTDGYTDWRGVDIIRGAPVYPINALSLRVNTSGAEQEAFGITLTPTGFIASDGSDQVNANGGNYIYIAIRRGPMAVPEDTTGLFALDTYGGTLPNPPEFLSDFTVDMAMYKRTNSAENWNLHSRLIQGKRLRPNTSDSEGSELGAQFDYMNGYYDGTSVLPQYEGYMWKRAPNYFDVVCYAGSVTTPRTISHNLGVAPEMIWIKGRDAGGGQWYVYHAAMGNQAYGRIDGSDRFYVSSDGVVAQTIWNATDPTASVFSLGNASNGNSNGQNYIAYLFATLDGVSKVGSYTGTGSGSQTIDCGFSNAARYVLVKDASDTGNWYVFDDLQGITSGSDPYLRLNTTAASQGGYDLIDPTSSGFIVNTVSPQNLNVSGRTYVFYAIAG